MELYDEVITEWIKEEADIKKKLDSWLSYIRNGLKADRSCFRQPKDLAVYTSFSDSRANAFSLRFKGQEVAKLRVRNKKVLLELTKEHLQNNLKHFCFATQTQPGIYDWHGDEAGKFRSHFKELKTQNGPRQREHEIESMIIREMKRTDGQKFGGTLRGIQPAMMGGCPFQMPLPISGSKGKPVAGRGNIDILARRIEGGIPRLSVWELKDENKMPESVINQTYIYCLTLLHILRKTNQGGQWWRFFGFNRPLPEKIEIEAVIALSDNMTNRLIKKWANKKESLQLTRLLDKDDSITFFVASYDSTTKPISINLQKLQ